MAKGGWESCGSTADPQVDKPITLSDAGSTSTSPTRPVSSRPVQKDFNRELILRAIRRPLLPRGFLLRLLCGGFYKICDGVNGLIHGEPLNRC
jgi:hypothetical protein